MRKALLALAVTAVLTATAAGAATAWSADNAGRTMHDQMTSTDMGSTDMSQMDMSAMAGMHTPEMDALHAQLTGEANGGAAAHAAHHDS